MNLEPVSKRVLYEGKKVALELHTFADDQGRRVTKEVCRHPGAVCVLPFLDDQTILMVRNRRWAIGGRWLLELPAGTLERGEDPMNCAGRELQEETGFLAGRLQRIADFYTAPGILGEQMHAFAAFNLQRTATAHEPGEEIEVLAVPWVEALGMIERRELTDAKSMLTLMLYERLQKR